MLTTLHIKNYRNLQELELNSIGQINLISGKNNTGKSSLLEAISIYANRASLDSIISCLDERRENIPRTRTESANILMERNVKSVSSLFYGRDTSFVNSPKIEIGSSDLDNLISLQFVRYREKEVVDENSRMRLERVILNTGLSQEIDSSDTLVGLEIKVGAFSRLVALSRPLTFFSSASLSNPISPINNQFIHTNNIAKETNGSLFDNITFTDKEQYVIDALRIIEPDTERIAFIEDNRRERIAVIKLSTRKDAIPLSSMGDGINRVLTMILALVNSANGYFLIDEFENGLHYTVQEQLWSVIFKLAKELNIQVFATTHSNDCISSFSKVLNSTDSKSMGSYIRLENIDGKIRQIQFSPQELDIAEEQDIEVR